jgi:hypothetical protein
MPQLVNKKLRCKPAQIKNLHTKADRKEKELKLVVSKIPYS